jgi:hypothetical protein
VATPVAIFRFLGLTEFCFSRRIQQTAAYKVHRSVGQKIATGRCGSIAPIRFLSVQPFDHLFMLADAADP